MSEQFTNTAAITASDKPIPLSEKDLQTKPGDPLAVYVRINVGHEPFTGLPTLNLSYSIIPQQPEITIQDILVDLIPNVKNDPSPHPTSVKVSLFFSEATKRIEGMHYDTQFSPGPKSGSAEVAISVGYFDKNGKLQRFNLLPIPTFPFNW